MINSHTINFDLTNNAIIAPSVDSKKPFCSYKLDEILKPMMVSINFVGYIISYLWKSYITFDNVKPTLLGMMILSDIVYWYRPTILLRELQSILEFSQQKTRYLNNVVSVCDFKKQIFYSFLIILLLFTNKNYNKCIGAFFRLKGEKL